MHAVYECWYPLQIQVSHVLHACFVWLRLYCRQHNWNISLGVWTEISPERGEATRVHAYSACGQICHGRGCRVKGTLVSPQQHQLVCSLLSNETGDCMANDVIGAEHPGSKPKHPQWRITLFLVCFVIYDIAASSSSSELWFAALNL